MPVCHRCQRPAPAEDSYEYNADWIVSEEEGEIVLTCFGCGTYEGLTEASKHFASLDTDDMAKRLRELRFDREQEDMGRIAGLAERLAGMSPDELLEDREFLGLSGSDRDAFIRFVAQKEAHLRELREHRTDEREGA